MKRAKQQDNKREKDRLKLVLEIREKLKEYSTLRPEDPMP